MAMTPGIEFIAVLFSLGIILLGLFLRSYVSKKAENLANRNDLVILNGRIEEIKNQNAVALTLLNANLSLASKGIESFEAETFKSYISFHQACSYILNDVANIDFTTLNIKNIEYLKGYNKSVMDSYKKIRLAKADHDLFNDNNEIREKAFALHKVCLTYISELNSLVAKIIFLLEGIADNNQKGMEMFFNKVDNKSLFDFYSGNVDEYKKDLGITRESLKSYITGETFAKAITVMTEYESLIRKYLKDEKKRLLTR